MKRLTPPDRAPQALPEHLHPMLRRAANGELPDLTTSGLNTPSGTNFYVLTWAVIYFITLDREHARSRLEHVHTLLKAAPPETGGADEEEVQETVYQIPAGARSKTCTCGKRIWFVKTETGARMPVTEFGLSHYLDCPDAKKHSRRKKAKA